MGDLNGAKWVSSASNPATYPGQWTDPELLAILAAMPGGAKDVHVAEGSDLAFNPGGNVNPHTGAFSQSAAYPNTAQWSL